MSKPKHKFVIHYRSGNDVAIRADELEVKWNTSSGAVTELTWDNMQPKPMKIGVQDIESIWQVK